MQIAVTIADEKVDEIDDLVPSLFRSRAEVVRVAVDEFLRAHRQRAIDAQYLSGLEAGSGDSGPGDPAPGAVGAGDQEPPGWAGIPW